MKRFILISVFATLVAGVFPGLAVASMGHHSKMKHGSKMEYRAEASDAIETVRSDANSPADAHHAERARSGSSLSFSMDARRTVRLTKSDVDCSGDHCPVCPLPASGADCSHCDFESSPDPSGLKAVFNGSRYAKACSASHTWSVGTPKVPDPGMLNTPGGLRQDRVQKRPDSISVLRL